MRSSLSSSAIAAACALALLSVDAAAARKPEPAPAPVEDLTSLELDQLMSMEVTGVTRRASAYGKSPAAIFVLTGDDIRRSGARTLAEVLRMVPGLQINRTSAQQYSVTSRGFSGDKMQVLLDGRSVYTPLTSTVFWNVLDTYFEDIARIEVIRGPGASVWGANAVNGVINIITVPAADSAGTHVFVGGGDEYKSFGGVRSGGRIGDWGKGRAYAKGREIDSTDRANGSENIDGQRMQQAGGRLDAELGIGALTVSGDIYQAREYAATFPAGTITDSEYDGRNLGVQWTRGWSGGASTQASAYYDGYDLLFPTVLTETRDTYDLNVQHNFAAMSDHLLTAGIGARATRDETGGGPQNVLVFLPPARTSETYSAFVQDEWAITDSFWLIGGTKIEHNDFTGWEYSPGIRAGWQFADTMFTWTSVARATRTPNRLDSDVAIYCIDVNNPPNLGCTTAGSTQPIGNPSLESEKLIAYEWGLRSQFIPSLLTDVALFYNDYTDLRSSETAQRFANGIDGEGMGGELSVSWQALDWVSVQAFYKYLKVDARKDPSSADTNTVNTLENGTAQQAAGLRIGVQPITTLSIDSFLRFVDSLPAQNVPQYTELNLRVGWAVTPFLELAVVGQNLLDAQHPEAGASATTRSENPRNAFAELSWRWQ